MLAAQVHRHHPPLVYGRGSLGLAPEFSEGAAVCAVPQGPTGQPTYAVVTYRRAPRAHPAGQVLSRLRSADWQSSCTCQLRNLRAVHDSIAASCTSTC